LTVDLRWPNDLLIGPSKAGGILVEAHSEGSSVSYAVVGIGINVHQERFAPGLSTPATSLDVEAGRRISRQSLLVALLKSLEREVHALAEESSAESIRARIERISTWVRGRNVEVHGPQACNGITAGLDQNGFLQVSTSAGMVTVQTGGIRQKTSF
jgi:BirA family biotin operon repressor/biotin-[acetyl-CoA-carboxylase] ligase